MKAISLFSGAGGLDLGITRAGFEIPLMVECDPACCDTLRANLKGEVLQADVSVLSGSDLLPGQEIDLVCGGPPCQSFSSAGKMGSLDDPRGGLVFEFARIVREKCPKCFLMENVRGLVTARGNDGVPGSVLLKLVREFEESGYSCATALLNSADYGACQRRVRCFVVGSMSGPPPGFPVTTRSKAKWGTLGDFLGEYTDLDEGKWTRPTKEMAAKLALVPDGKGLRNKGHVEATRPGGHWGYKQGGFIADQDLPARTVTGSSSQDWLRLGNGSLRRITMREAAGLQGFPSNWAFQGTKSQKFKQIGNAVQVDVAEAVGKALMRYLRSYEEGRPGIAFQIPQAMTRSIEYTKREERRNGASRKR